MLRTTRSRRAAHAGLRASLAVLTVALLAPYPLHAQRGRAAAPAAANPPYDATLFTNGGRTNKAFKALRWRLVGPFRGGRVVAVTGDPVKPLVFYMGAVNGGVWKTTNAGQSWDNISDGTSDISSVGAIAVAPSDPNVIWVGTGEGQPREDLTYGTGIYRSTDGGKSWQHLGLTETHQVSQLRVDPRDPDRAYVAALGHAFGPNPERGIFRTTDGGKTWKKVLFLNDSIGAADIQIDQQNPRILLASMWKFQRSPWGMEAGGSRSGLWKSTDGGDTWTEITFNPGLPKGPLGKIGIAISPANGQRMYLSVEAHDSAGGIFRSDDGGDHWTRASGDQRWGVRPWYYSQVTADPKNPDVLYVMNLSVWKSIDAGRTWSRVRVPHGDTHQTWIAPNDPDRMINGNDGGATVSLDGGKTWSSIYNQPTAQFYHVITDTQWPYRIYGAQQDNTTISIASRSDFGAITERDWWPVAGCENAHIAIDPKDANVTYGGCYTGFLNRHDHKTNSTKDISVWLSNYDGWAVADVPNRFQWTFPVKFSTHDPDVLYATSQHVWRSRTRGNSWEKISPDLTVHDPKTMGRSGGPVTGDMTGTEWYATIYAFAESPRQKGVLWTGSDDGLVHVSRDDGATWQNVTPPTMGKFARITEIEPSPHAAGTAYVSATRYQQDDFRPYFYKTTDFGKTWTLITSGIPVGAYSRSLREDPVRKGLLYAGTEAGVYVSFDDGGSWEPLQLNLPRASVRDLRVTGNDLIVATHGRAFWSLDDLTPLRLLADSVTTRAAFLFPPAKAVRFAAGRSRRNGPEGENPPSGIVVDYWLKEKPKAPITLQFLDPQGALIRTYASAAAPRADSTGHPAADSAAALAREKQGAEELAYEPPDSVLHARAGTNRFVWNLRYPSAKLMPGAIIDEGTGAGPVAVPGTYTVRLIAGKDTLTRTAELVGDPRQGTPQSDYVAQFTLAKRTVARMTELTENIQRVQATQAQIEQRQQQAAGKAFAERVSSAGKALRGKFEAVRAEIYEVYTKADQATLNYPVKLYQMFLTLNMQVQEGDQGITQQHGAIFTDLSGKLEVQLQIMRKLEQADLAEFNKLLKEVGLPDVYVPPVVVP
jgi:photosystem II stability/assembly factor-like uncharacterized protein